MFTNLIAYRFPIRYASDFGDTLEAKLGEHRLKPVGVNESSAQGFVSPFGDQGEVLSANYSGLVWFTLGVEEKVIPSQALRREIRRRQQEAEQAAGHTLSARARRELAHQALDEMLPKAFVKYGQMHCFVDPASGTLVVDAGSPKAADRVVRALRSALGSFPALPLNPERPVSMILTGWLAGEGMPEELYLGSSVEMRDPADGAAVVRISGQELTGEEITGHLDAGKRCVKLGIVNGMDSQFVLTENLHIKQVRIQDTKVEQSREEIGEANGANDIAAANFILSATVANALLQRIYDIFAVTPAEPLFQLVMEDRS